MRCDFCCITTFLDGLASLKLTAKAPENRPSPKEISSSNHPFSGGELLVLVYPRLPHSEPGKGGETTLPPIQKVGCWLQMIDVGIESFAMVFADIFSIIILLLYMKPAMKSSLDMKHPGVL